MLSPPPSPHRPPPHELGRVEGGRVESGREQVAGGQAAVGPPLLGDGHDLLLRGAVIELIGGLDGLAQCEIAGQDDVFTLQRDDEGALHGPRANARNSGELGHQLVVRQLAQGIGVQPAVRHPPGQVPERADLPPREPGRAELVGLDAQQLGGCRKPPAEHGLDARQGPPGGRDGQLLPGDLEQQRAEQVHRGQLGYPRPGIEIRPVVDEPGQHRVRPAQVRTRSGQPRGIVGHPSMMTVPS